MKKNPLKYVHETMNPGEALLGEHFAQTRWQYLRPAILGVPLLIWFLQAEEQAGAAFFFLLFTVAPWSLIILLRRYSTEHAVTTRRLVKKTGLVARKGEEILLVKTESVQVSQGLFGRLLNYGDVRATGTGSQCVIFDRVVDPMACKRAVESALLSGKA